MMKTLTAVFLAFLALLYAPDKTLHDFSITALDSDAKIDFSDYSGKKILVVNVASKCGYTHQYVDLQKLHSRYSDKLVVIGFPCDQFMGQELDSEKEIASFCKKNYNVTFPLTTMISVKGDKQHPIYSYLTQKNQNGVGDYNIKWNFNKFLIDESGRVIKYFPSEISPLSEEIISYLN